MAYITPSRYQPLDPALSDVTFSRINRPKFVCPPTEQLQKLLSSPQRAKFLPLNGIIVNEISSVMAPTKNSNPFSGDSDKSARISQGNGAIVHADNASRVVRVKADVRKAPPLVKELPPKPVLRQLESPERRGILDAVDSASQRLNYPVVKPATAGISPAHSDDSKFKATPSILSADDNASDADLGTATVIIQRANTSSVKIVRAPLQGTHRQPSVEYSLSTPRPSGSRVPSLGHVAAHMSGSPMQRMAVAGNPNRSKLNVEKTSSIKKDMFTEEEGVISETKSEPNIESKVSSILPPVPDTPVDDTLRRSVKYGLGPMVRFSTEASEVIMGNGSRAANGGGKQPNIKFERYPARFSSLSSPKGISTERSTLPPSSASRLARPTAASSSRAAESKAAIAKSGKIYGKNNSSIPKSTRVLGSSPLPHADSATSMKKGFRSRLSSMLPRRRRSETQGTINDSHRRDHTTSDGSVIPERGSVALSKSSVSPSLTTYENVRVNGSHSDYMRRYPGEIYKGKDNFRALLNSEPTDKVALARGKHDHGPEALRSNRAHGATNANASLPIAAIQDISHSRPVASEDNDPPTPPPTRGGPQGHYADDVSQASAQAQLNVGNNSSMGNHLNRLLRVAEDELRQVVAAMNEARSPVLRSRYARLIEELGRGIRITRSASIAIIALQTTTELLATQISQMVAMASAAAATAITEPEV